MAMSEPLPAADADPETANIKPFPGTPKIYKRIAIWGSYGFHAYLFVGYWAIKTFIAGETWPTSWVPAVVAVVSATLFAYYAYRWIMRLDAQYGRGSGWVLISTRVKLPWERPRRK